MILSHWIQTKFIRLLDILIKGMSLSCVTNGTWERNGLWVCPFYFSRSLSRIIRLWFLTFLQHLTLRVGINYGLSCWGSHQLLLLTRACLYFTEAGLMVQMAMAAAARNKSPECTVLKQRIFDTQPCFFLDYRKIIPQIKFPPNWLTFLHVSQILKCRPGNKTVQSSRL